MSGTYRNLKIDQLLRPSTHLIVETKPILSHIIRSKHKIALALSITFHDCLVARSDDHIINVEGTA